MKAWTTLKKVIRQVFTGPDNRTADIVRITGGFMAIQFVVNSAYALFAKAQEWDPNNYGLGAAALLAALGAAMRVARPVSDTGETP